MATSDGKEVFSTVPDAKGDGFTVPSAPTPGGDVALNQTKSDLVSNEYKMDHGNRGYAVIINNKNFEKLKTRTGTDIDRHTVFQLLLTMGFSEDRIKVKNDCTVARMKEILVQASGRDYKDCDCFVAVIMSHGKKDGDIYGTDEPIAVEELTAPFKGTKCNPTLRGKPKFFIFQACRGEAEDKAVVAHDTDLDEDETDLQIPSEADFLLAFSCVPGYLSWRVKEEGTWYIQSVGKIFNKNWKTEDLVSMLTEVNKTVAIDYEILGTKQMPCFSSRLIKKVFFHAEKPNAVQPVA